ncbi:VirB4 family type IV secretion/conjugal transfer ATPase [Escherichia coli]
MAATAEKINPMDFKKEPGLLKYLPYSYHVTPHIISTVNGEYLSVFRLRGRTHDCASNAELVKWHADLNYMLKAIGNERVKLWTHLHHREERNYPQAHFDRKFPAYFDAYYSELFSDVPLMVNDLYLTIVYNPLGDTTQKLLAKFEKATPDEQCEIQADAIASLEEICDQVTNTLKPYGISRLGYYYRDKRGNIITEPKQEEIDADLDVDTDDILDEAVTRLLEQKKEQAQNYHTFSSALEWFSYLVNGEWSPVPVCRERIREYLATTRPTSSLWGDGIQLRLIDETRYTCGIEVRDYDMDTEPGQINILMEAPFEFILTQTYCCMSQQSARTYLSNQQKALLETHDPAQGQIQQMNDALEGVVSRSFIMGWHHLTVHTYATSLKQARSNASVIKTMLNNSGLIASTVGLASEAAYFAKLPGNQHLAPRPCPLNSWNFLCFSPFHNFMSGKANNNPWGPALMQLKTVAGTPLFLNMHVTPEDELSFGKRPLGHLLTLGRSGAGKTTLLGAMATQATKYDARMYFYDSDQGLMPLVILLGGHYTHLKEGMPTNWAPLQMPATAKNIAFAKRLMRVCAETTLGDTLPTELATELVRVVDALMDKHSLIPPSERTIKFLSQMVTLPELAKLLHPWTRNGEHGWLFDNDTDTLNVTKYDIYGFDLSDFVVSEGELPSPARSPMLMYLNYRVRSSIDGKRRVIQWYDEFHRYLDDPIMDVEIKRGLKTDRKKDAVYAFATQEPNDALECRIGKTIVQQTVTKILLENPDASYDDYVTGMKLTPSEYEALLSIPENSRQFLVKQGSQSALAEMNLSPRVKSAENFKRLDKILSVLSGTPDNAARLAEIMEKTGEDDPDKLLELYWKAVVAA